jgi:hypothetical protein
MSKTHRAPVGKSKSESSRAAPTSSASNQSVPPKDITPPTRRNKILFALATAALAAWLIALAMMAIKK